ncbi:excisionase family DNA binding protein [Nonomuraea thailandensis]|uniref:Excisionase family DNA binding protein n=1 Tax=Nonomuraea thailandensis TaxID=1188745 RepID=A0A9X2KBQ6_9ACTN|nr:helix-turn-helix domain-containing protein [Nonomuraea thailandensis]MCP2364241.1 excisionase family DNA binding protein [Nonomuraea thailandensis]
MSSESKASPQLEPELLKLPEAATIMNVSLRTVYQLINSGELDSYRIRGNRRISRQHLDEYLERALRDTRPTLGERHHQAVSRPRRNRTKSSA